MPEIRLGSCSICGGDVVGWQGAWFSVNPPPPPECKSCGARTRVDIIAMGTPQKINSMIVKLIGGSKDGYEEKNHDDWFGVDWAKVGEEHYKVSIKGNIVYLHYKENGQLGPKETLRIFL